ncbi:MAG TPA: site-2 protease family protein [Acidimicrobiales bacterium]|jgi:membrane-associated protease RseP (regulator of RpoE activity)|nr:site-2 protease family protein [Acidimicrobiales bacterium]|tara:strand:- start:249 stop:1481 length:1233 start_codon:yes stop_codon:yes gene_type:complete
MSDSVTAAINPRARALMGAAAVAGSLMLLGWVSMAMLAVAMVIAFVVFAHELGHFVAARLTGMKATEFFLGFGPRLFSFRRGETEFGVKPIIAGAYVKVVGMTNLDDVPPSDEPRAYRQQSYPRRLLVASAGSLMHFVMALIGLFALFSFMGEPVIEDGAWEVGKVVDEGIGAEQSAAARAGIQPGDRILHVEGDSTVEWANLVEAIRNRPGEKVELEILRGDQTLSVETVLDRSADGTGLLGIGGQQAILLTKSDPVAAIGKTFSEFSTMVGQSIRGIWLIVANLGEVADRFFSAPNDPTANDNLETRPVSLVGAVQIGASDQLSSSERMQLFVAFNIFIGIFNLLPLLPLDGGHIAIATYERIREGSSGRRHLIDTTRLLPFTYAVVAFLAFFGLGAIYLDLANPLGF